MGYVMRNPRAAVLKAERRQFVAEYKTSRGCVDCGEKDPRCLDLDHRSNKVMGVAVMISTGRSLSVILEEMAKCDVRCSNCHRKKHF
jgi:repressor of nif and glnA expression